MPAASASTIASAGAPANDASTNDASTPNDPPPASCSDQSGLHGTYTVPVSPELTPYASFDVSSIQFCEHGGSTTLSYDLPALLVGAATHVSFRGVFDASAPTLELTGDQGSASCSETGRTWTCHESLTGIEIRTDKLREELVSLPADEAQARTDVADAFSQDPIGVLTFSAP